MPPTTLNSEEPANPYICSQDAEFAGGGNQSWRRENLGVP